MRTTWTVCRIAVAVLGAVLAAPLPAAAGEHLTTYSLLASADSMLNLFAQEALPYNHYYLIVSADPFNTEYRFVLRFDRLNDGLSLRPYDASRITRARLQVYEAPGLGGGPRAGVSNMRVSVYRLADDANWSESTVQRPGPRIVPGTPVATQTVGAPDLGGWATWDVTEHVRYWVEHPERNQGFLVAGQPEDQTDPDHWGYTSITFESRDSVFPEFAYIPGGGNLPAGHAPRLLVDVRGPLPRAVAPSPTVYTVATPTPTPTAEKSPKKTTKGAFAERTPVNIAPWWMSDFLSRLLGYE